jgi:hypothetical protein
MLFLTRSNSQGLGAPELDEGEAGRRYTKEDGRSGFLTKSVSLATRISSVSLVLRADFVKELPDAPAADGPGRTISPAGYPFAVRSFGDPRNAVAPGSESARVSYRYPWNGTRGSWSVQVRLFFATIRIVSASREPGARRLTLVLIGERQWVVRGNLFQTRSCLEKLVSAATALAAGERARPFGADSAVQADAGTAFFGTLWDPHCRYQGYSSGGFRCCIIPWWRDWNSALSACKIPFDTFGDCRASYRWHCRRPALRDPPASHRGSARAWIARGSHHRTTQRRAAPSH